MPKAIYTSWPTEGNQSLVSFALFERNGLRLRASIETPLDQRVEAEKRLRRFVATGVNDDGIRVRAL